MMDLDKGRVLARMGTIEVDDDLVDGYTGLIEYQDFTANMLAAGRKFSVVMTFNRIPDEYQSVLESEVVLYMPLILLAWVDKNSKTLTHTRVLLGNIQPIGFFAADEIGQVIDLVNISNTCKAYGMLESMFFNTLYKYIYKHNLHMVCVNTHSHEKALLRFAKRYIKVVGE